MIVTKPTAISCSLAGSFPFGRKGNIVYARSLRPGEEDTGEGVHVKAGERLVIPAGELIINSREVDAYYNPAGTGG